MYSMRVCSMYIFVFIVPRLFLFVIRSRVFSRFHYRNFVCFVWSSMSVLCMHEKGRARSVLISQPPTSSFFSPFFFSLLFFFELRTFVSCRYVRVICTVCVFIISHIDCVFDEGGEVEGRGTGRRKALTDSAER